MQRRRIVNAVIGCILIALLLGAFGCEESQPQLLALERATPSPAPDIVNLGGEEKTGRKFSVSVLSPNDGILQADGSIRTQDGDVISVFSTEKPAPTARLTPTPVPTAPPEMPAPSPTYTPEPTPTATEEPDDPTPSPKAAAKTTAKVTNTPKPTGTPTQKPTATPEPAFTITPAPTDTPAPTATPAQTSSQEPPEVSGPYSGDDVLLAARVAYFESGKSEDGYRAVVCVIVNRVESGKWPNSINDVVYQKSQFSVVGKSDFLTKIIPDSVIGYANDVLNGGNRLLSSDVMSFRSTATDKTWGTRTYCATYGGNDFYS